MSPLSAAPVARDPERDVAFLAHELRTATTLQRAVAEVALSDPDADLSTLRAMGERIVVACRRQEQLLDSLLELARSRRTRRLERVDLARTVADVLPAVAGPGSKVAASLRPAPVVGDPALLGSLVTNLIRNAVLHNVPGGSIGIGTRAAGSRTVLTVANTGAPVPSAELRRLFRPFERLHAAEGEGTGLGLALVEAIAHAHEARVVAGSRPAGGLRIEVVFPRPVDEPSRASGYPASRASRPSRNRCSGPGCVSSTARA